MQAEDYYLIQGPPGTGKSFVLSLIIIAELLHYKRKVVVVGPNHLAINNAICQVLKMWPELGSNLVIKVGQSYNAPLTKIEEDGQEYSITNAHHLAVNKVMEPDFIIAIGMTPHSFYTSRARFLEVDTLIVDEAGQMTIPLALMGMIKAKKVIFAGDHKQLAPIVSSDNVPEELKKSAFQTLITKENCTMLDTSFRMCEQICDFVSELFYDSKLKAKKKGCGDAVKCSDPLFNFGDPIIVHHVDDNGEQTSDKEAELIADIIAGYLGYRLPAEEIAVLSPFRAQAANVRRHIRKNKDIPEESRSKIASDTVDKMQGQEREVIIFSLTSGDTDYMTEMADFLYNPNKLNVAFSRAKSKLIIVGNIDQLSHIDPIAFPHIQKMLESKLIKIIQS